MDLSKVRCPKCRAVGQIKDVAGIYSSSGPWYYCQSCRKRVNQKEIDLCGIGALPFPPGTMTIQAIRRAEQRLLDAGICELCGLKEQKLVLHHWFNQRGHRFEKVVCISCNGRLSKVQFYPWGGGDHILPSWRIQRAFAVRGYMPDDPDEDSEVMDLALDYLQWIKYDKDWLKEKKYSTRDLLSFYPNSLKHIYPQTLGEVWQRVKLPQTFKEWYGPRDYHFNPYQSHCSPILRGLTTPTNGLPPTKA